MSKSLEKDCNLRYQHAPEIRADLQRLKRDTESGRRVLALGDVTGMLDPNFTQVGAKSGSAIRVRKLKWVFIIALALLAFGGVGYWK